MKLSELKFKVILGTVERREAFLKSIKAAGVNGSIIDADFIGGANFAWWDYDSKCESFVYNTQSFCRSFENCEYPLIKLDDAIRVLAEYAERQPKLPFKPKDWCMATDPGAPYGWKLAIYSNIADCAFQCIGSYYRRIAPLDEKMLGVVGNPAEWGGLCDGKPKRMRG